MKSVSATLIVPVDDELHLQTENGTVVVSSRVVAERFVKRHGDVIEKVDKLITEMNSTEKSVQYFIQSQYRDGSGKSNKEYLLTRDGFTLLAMGFTGKQALQWKMRYIEAFNKLEDYLNEQSNPLQNMSPELQAIIMQDKKIQVIEEQVTHTGERISNLENTMVIDYGQAQEIRQIANLVVVNALGGKSSLAYRKLSKRAFSEFWKYYKQCFGVESYRNTPRVQFDNAKALMYQWQPSDELKALIAYEQQAPVRNMTQPRPVQPIQVKGVVMRG